MFLQVINDEFGTQFVVSVFINAYIAPIVVFV